MNALLYNKNIITHLKLVTNFKYITSNVTVLTNFQHTLSISKRNSRNISYLLNNVLSNRLNTNLFLNKKTLAFNIGMFILILHNFKLNI